MQTKNAGPNPVIAAAFVCSSISAVFMLAGVYVLLNESKALGIGIIAATMILETAYILRTILKFDCPTCRNACKRAGGTFECAPCRTIWTFQGSAAPRP